MVNLPLAPAGNSSSRSARRTPHHHPLQNPSLLPGSRMEALLIDLLDQHTHPAFDLEDHPVRLALSQVPALSNKHGGMS